MLCKILRTLDCHWKLGMCMNSTIFCYEKVKINHGGVCMCVYTHTHAHQYVLFDDSIRLCSVKIIIVICVHVHVCTHVALLC